jgi:hypothetical protein
MSMAVAPGTAAPTAGTPPPHSLAAAEPLAWADHRLIGAVCERAVQQVQQLPGVSQHGQRVLDAPVTKATLGAITEEEGLGAVCEALLAAAPTLDRVFTSYATSGGAAAAASSSRDVVQGGGGAAATLVLPNSRFQQFMSDHALYSQRHLPKKHAGSLFEALLAHELPGDERVEAESMSAASHRAGAGGGDGGGRGTPPMDESLAAAPNVLHGGGARGHGGGAGVSGLNSVRFGAALVYIATSAAVVDVVGACVQSLSAYGEGAGKPPPSLAGLAVAKLRTLIAALTPMAGTSSVSEVQAAIYHPDVQQALARSNASLLKVFMLAAGQDDDPEMSREEFLKLMSAGKIGPPAVPAGELERVFDFFARDDGDGPSMVYRDMLEALVVVVQLVSPSPLTPLADRVRAFLRRREGSFLSAATVALSMRRAARK